MTNPHDDLSPSAPEPPAAAGLNTVLERFARDYLKDRRVERRWRILFRWLWLGLFLLAAVGAVMVRHHAAAPSAMHTALIEVRGEIASDTEASAEILITALRLAFEDEAAQAVVLRFNSPGGSPVQAGMVNDEIHRLKALHNKKVYAVVEESCASGAYYIAVAADEIYTDKASVIGSIGVLMDSFGFTGTLQKLGVERRLMTAGENKAIGDPFLPFSEKHRAYTQTMLDQIHRQFIAVVKTGRGARLKPTSDMFSGLYWNGEDAIKLGLVDHLGSLDYVAREVVKAPDVIDYTPKENVAERLVKRFGASMAGGAVKALRGEGALR